MARSAQQARKGKSKKNKQVQQAQEEDVAKNKKQPEQEEESASGEEEMEVDEKSSKKVVPAKTKGSRNGDDSEEEESESEEEESKQKEAKQKKRKSSPTKAAKPTKKAKVEEEEDDSEDSMEDDSSEDDVDPKKLKKKVPVTAQEKPKKKAKVEAKEEDISDSEDSEEEAKATPAKGKKSKDDSDDGSDESSEEDDKEEVKSKSEDKSQKKAKPKSEGGSDSGSSTLFVKGFDEEMTEKKLKKAFKGCDAIRLNEKKRYAFIDFPNAEVAKEIYDANQGLELDGNTLVVDMANKKPDRPERQSSGSDSNTLFVKNIPEDCNRNDLEEFFDGVSSVRMPERDGYHKGFAFVEFTSVELAKSALKEKQGAELNGNKLYLDMAGEKPNRNTGNRPGKSNVLFVKNLSFDTDEDTLKDSFNGAQSARIMKFPDTGKSKGFGFVDFDSTESAQQACNEMQGQEIDGRSVLVDFATPRGDRSSGGRGGRGGFRGGRGRDWGRGGGRDFRGGRGGRGGFGRGGFGGRGGGRGYGGGGGGGGRRTHFDDSD